MLNVGIPDTADASTRRRITRIAQAGYDRLFAEQSPGVYVHQYGGLVESANATDGDTDIDAARDTVISISAIAGAGDAAAPIDLRGLVI